MPDAPGQRVMHGKGVPSRQMQGKESGKWNEAQREKLAQWRSERYAVRQPMKNDVVMRSKAGEPVVDLFADPELHLCAKWYGPGGVCENAFMKDWGEEGLCWCNPPFSRLQEVVQKIVDDRAQVILIMPHWTNYQWFEDVQPYVVRKYFYKKGTLFF